MIGLVESLLGGCCIISLSTGVICGDQLGMCCNWLLLGWLLSRVADVFDRREALLWHLGAARVVGGCCIISLSTGVICEQGWVSSF